MYTELLHLVTLHHLRKFREVVLTDKLRLEFPRVDSLSLSVWSLSIRTPSLPHSRALLKPPPSPSGSPAPSQALSRSLIPPLSTTLLSEQRANSAASCC